MQFLTGFIWESQQKKAGFTSIEYRMILDGQYVGAVVVGRTIDLKKPAYLKSVTKKIAESLLRGAKK